MGFIGCLKALACTGLTAAAVLVMQTGFDGGGPDADLSSRTDMTAEVPGFTSEPVIAAEAVTGVEIEAEAKPGVANECLDSCLAPCLIGCGPLVSEVEVTADVAADVAAFASASDCACGGDGPNAGLALGVEGNGKIDTTQSGTGALVRADASASLGD